MVVVCSRYRLSEEQKAGGFCEFDITFIEWGAPPFTEAPDSGVALLQNAQSLKDQVGVMLQSSLEQAPFYNWRPPVSPPAPRRLQT